MKYLDRIKEENEGIRERYELAMERIEKIEAEKGNMPEKFQRYFQKTANFLVKVRQASEWAARQQWKEDSLEQCKKRNKTLYEDLLPKEKCSQGQDGYEKSYGNPDYAVKQLGEEYGQYLCFLYTELRGCIAYAHELRLFDMTIVMELFIQIYNIFEDMESCSKEAVHNAIYYYISDYCDVTMPKRTKEMLDPSLSFATEIIMNSDLTDLRYLYQYGEYITENEIGVASYLNQLSQEQIDTMASTYTEGYRKGFIAANIDLSEKKTVNIRYCLGFERMVRSAILQFQSMGLEPTIYRAAVSSIHKKQDLKIGYYGTSVNRQYDYDHRFDQALYLDKPLADRKLVNLRLGYETYEQMATEYSGPAVIEVFGEEEFTPKNKKYACRLSKKQQKIQLEYQRDAGLLQNEFIPSDQYSFTIIAYPIPEIGENFEEIFSETVKVNTLDMDKYCKIQQKIIDVLDQGEYVKVIGAGKNKTNITVQLPPLNNPDKETNFENCLADVNIPVGEVFTSPQLEGTFGHLHVSEVYLAGLRYVDLELEFEEGKIKKYYCRNFSKEGVEDTPEIKQQNQDFIKENLMFQHSTLPIGEFAIGTNTTAYMMGKKYGISHKLPILIAEKTGPHFAVGDTCYSMSEENRLFNPDGKEIVAKDNSCSILRKTDIEKAYFNCHTDITIPYDELGEITVYTVKGEEITIIKNGRFVLSGTEELNKAFEDSSFSC
ncbi:MAG: aminopeptidase [Clostridiales bacterium]|nr:aminopeptidase [Clostridiales bacterium]